MRRVELNPGVKCPECKSKNIIDRKKNINLLSSIKKYARKIKIPRYSCTNCWCIFDDREIKEAV